MINIFVQFTDGTVSQYQGQSFKHGDKALVLTTENGYMAIPQDKVRAYEVQKAKAEEPDSSGVMDAEVSFEESGVEEEADTKEEEAS